MPVNNPPALHSPRHDGQDSALTASCTRPGAAGDAAGVTCGDYAVNTIQPIYQPFQPGTAQARSSRRRRRRRSATA
jgi:phospholipase C